MLVSDRRATSIAHARKLSTQAREPVAALRAHRDRLQLPAEQPPRRRRARAARGLPERVAARPRINARYRELLDALPGSTSCPTPSDGRRNCWLTCITRRSRSVRRRPRAIRLALEAADIESRPLLEADAPAARVRGAARCSAATSRPRLFERGLCLPSGSALSRGRPGPRRRDRPRDCRALTLRARSTSRSRPSCRRRRASATSGRCGR